MKIQIIPDIHNKWYQAEEMIEKEGADKVVFLGDYFDSIGDNMEVTEQTAWWLKKSLEKPNRIHLLGNHDLSYLKGEMRCGGFDGGKLFIIKNVVKVDLTKLKHYCWVDDYLCTHAGLSNEFYNAHNYHYFEIEKFLEWMIHNNEERLYQCSPYRGGQDGIAGIVWCDYDEFVDIPGVRQIFGHTHASDVRIEGSHICLDTWLKYYAVYDTKTRQMEIKKSDS
ncbi:metallophosphoesterase [Nitrosopumilus sp.]|uniref:metallophosphoesterase n=1 Tax=Nitrosopumilus sp. TaxID=2024843 RepID=UPI003D0C51A2